MRAKPAPSANPFALPDGTELVGDYRIRGVLGAGGFGITYLADETALDRLVTIKEYFPADFAARQRESAVVARSRDTAAEYQWGLDRFIEEAQTLARFDHPNIVRVHRYFRTNNTGYMVLHFEDGGSLRSWLAGLGRAPRQDELDRLIAPLLDALAFIHAADFLHRDIAPDNIMLRKDGSPVLIDFGSARGAIAGHSRTVSALVKPGYSPYEQYATSGAKQGPWTDIYALGATLYHAVTGNRPPDAPSRVVEDEYVRAREVALGTYRRGFLEAIDKALRIEVRERPQSIAEWRGALLAPEAAAEAKPARAGLRLPRTLGGSGRKAKPAAAAGPRRGEVPASLVPPPPDAPQRQGELLDFIEALEKREPSSPGKAGRDGKAKRDGKAGKATGRGRRKASPSPPEARAADGAAATPAQRAARAEPVTTRRRRWWLRLPSRRWRVAMFRIAAGVAIASLAVAYQERARAPARDGPEASDAAAPARPLQLAGHRGPVVAVAGGDGDRWIVSAGADATVRLWSAASGALVRTIEVPEGPVTAFAVAERRALTGHDGGTIVLWDLELGEKLATFQHGSEAIAGLAFVGGAETFVASRGDGSVALFRLGTPAASATLLDGEESAGPMLAAAPARGLVVSGGRDGSVRLWRADGPRLVRTWRHPAGDLGPVALSADGALVAAAADDGTVRVWRNASRAGVQARLGRRLEAHAGRVTALALGPEGVLASAGEDGAVKLWHVGGEVRVRALGDGIGRVGGLSFSRDGRRLYAAGADGVIRVWTLAASTTAGLL
jgi:serine/threonine protein kinase